MKYRYIAKHITYTEFYYVFDTLHQRPYYPDNLSQKEAKRMARELNLVEKFLKRVNS